MTTITDHAVAKLQAGLAVRPIDGWVVIYAAAPTGDYNAWKPEPLYLRLVDTKNGWTAAGIDSCTVFESYGEAVKAAELSPWIMRLLPPERRVVRIKITGHVSIEVEHDLPIGVLDALAEL
jgi:hypothetical protein